MSPERFKVHHKTRKKLTKLLQGNVPVRVSRRARILLEAHAGYSTDEIADRVVCGTATVKRVKRRFVAGGMEHAVYDAPRPGRPKKLRDEQEKEIIALACTDPPEGKARWTVRLLVQHCNKDVGFGVVQRILAEDGLKPWREKNVVHSDAHGLLQSSDV